MTTLNHEILLSQETLESRRRPEKIARYNIKKGFDLLDTYNIENRLTEIKKQFFPDWKIIKTPNIDKNLFRYINPSPESNETLFNIATLELTGPKVEKYFSRSEFTSINAFQQGHESFRVQTNANEDIILIIIMPAFCTCQEPTTFGTPKNPFTTTIHTKDSQKEINSQIQDSLNQGCRQIKEARELRDLHCGQLMKKRISLI